MAKYDWKVEPRDEDWSDELYAYFLIHINLERMVEYLTKEFKKDWWFKADYGQDNCYIVAENNDFPVRLFFTFDEGGWADITRHYTDGATYTDDHLGSWHFAKYDTDYSYNKDNPYQYNNLDYNNSSLACSPFCSFCYKTLKSKSDNFTVLSKASKNSDKKKKEGDMPSSIILRYMALQR